MNAMSCRFAAVVTFITAAIFAEFAVWSGTDPEALLAAFGMDRVTSEMLTEIDAFYGGVDKAIAVTMVILWWRGELFAALLVGGLALVGSGSGWEIGMLIDRFSSTHASFAVGELLSGALYFSDMHWCPAANDHLPNERWILSAICSA